MSTLREELQQEQEAKGYVSQNLRPIYETRALKVLDSIRLGLEKTGFSCSSCEYQGYDCGWGFVVYISGDSEYIQDGDIDVGLSFDVSEECDGTPGGLTIALRITAVGGTIIGGLTPYNYTDDVFVPRTNLQAIEERFSIFESADPKGAVELIKEWSDRYRRGRGVIQVQP